MACLVIGNTLNGLMGVEPNAPADAFASLPRLVAEVPWVQVDHVPLGFHGLALRHDGSARSALRHNSGDTNTMASQVRVDGARVLDGPVLDGSAQGLDLEIDVSRADQLRLVITDGGDGISGDHADWADARLLPASGSDKGPREAPGAGERGNR